ncbi:MAG: hypothetical protein KC619_32245 [Myxococcales bacterium]|nr:hypothetical protein [Myxococcales bacterium]
MRRRARRLRHLALIAAALGGLVSAARAHGPAPVALEVLAHDGRVPTVLRTNLGLAVANGDGTYAYVCPSRWDGNELALAAAARGGDAILVESTGVAYLSTDRGCTFARLTGEELWVSAIARHGDGFLFAADEYPVDVDPDRSRLFTVLADGTVEELALGLPGAIDGLVATPDGVLIAGHRPVGFVATPDGVLSTFETTSSRLTPRNRGGGDVWLRSAEGSTVTLARVSADGTPETPALRATTVQGPVLVDGAWYALFDGALHTYREGTWSFVDEVSFTCLRPFDERNFACSLAAMYELGSPQPRVPEATAVFSMDQLGPPAACGDASQQEACDLDWAHFGGESGWLDTLPATSPTSERRTPSVGGCALAPSPPGALGLLVVAGALARLRRRAPRRTRA